MGTSAFAKPARSLWTRVRVRTLPPTNAYKRRVATPWGDTRKQPTKARVQHQYADVPLKCELPCPAAPRAHKSTTLRARADQARWRHECQVLQRVSQSLLSYEQTRCVQSPRSTFCCASRGTPDPSSCELGTERIHLAACDAFSSLIRTRCSASAFCR